MGELKQHQPPMTIDEQEEKYNDKSIIHLPRQDTGNSLKSLDLSGRMKFRSTVLDQV